jgi:hypothetical protein
MTILQLQLGTLPHRKRCFAARYSHAESAWAMSKGGRTMAKSLIRHLFNISLDGKCPLDMLDEHFLVSIYALVCQSNVHFVVQRGASGTLDCQEENTGCPLCKLKDKIAHKSVAPVFLVKSPEFSTFEACPKPLRAFFRKGKCAVFHF